MSAALTMELCPSTTPSMKRRTTMPKVSVILTSRNHENFLHEAIQSVLAQTYKNFELIIWDDASTDNSWSIIEQANDSRVRAFRGDVQRRGRINESITEEIAKGEYIAIHHSDDVWEADKLEKQVSFLDQNSEIGAVFSWVNIIDDGGNINNDTYIYKVFMQNNKTRHEWLRHFFFSGNALCHPSVLIRKQCYTDCGLYNLLLWQLPDFDMWVRLCFKYEIHVLPECLVKFRWKHDGNNTSSVNRQSLNRTAFEYYMLLNNYCNIASIEEFLKIFPSSEKYCTHPDADMEFALAMTAIELNSSPKHRLFGLQLLYKLMISPQRAKNIYTAHHFDYMDFANLSKQEQIFVSPSLSSLPQIQQAPLEQGIRAYKQENFEMAIECLSTAMFQEPNNPLPYAYLAFVCVHQGLFQEAHDFIVQATRIAPERADLIAALGEIFLKNGRPSEAAEYLREAVNAQPDLFAAYPALAQSLHLTGQSEEAVSLLQAVSILPSDAQQNIRYVLQQILAERDDLPDFTEHAPRFSHESPISPVASGR
jgi:glycosyltransferase involved in cell wall biosynthesis